MSLWTPALADLLRAVIDRMIPRDEYPSASDLGVDRYILQQLQTGALAEQERIHAGLEALSSAIQKCHDRQFQELTEGDPDEALRSEALAPWFQMLAELTAEGYYADPGNGGNTDARSWIMIGYEHRLPDGPSGPCYGESTSAATLSRTGDVPDDMDVQRPVETSGGRAGNDE